MDTLPICYAKSKQSGKRCRNYARKGRNVCHIHGGKTPRHNLGPKTCQGKQKQKMGSWKHGLRSKEKIKEQKNVMRLIKKCKSLLTMS